MIMSRVMGRLKVGFGFGVISEITGSSLVIAAYRISNFASQSATQQL